MRQEPTGRDEPPIVNINDVTASHCPFCGNLCLNDRMPHKCSCGALTPYCPPCDAWARCGCGGQPPAERALDGRVDAILDAPTAAHAHAVATRICPECKSENIRFGMVAVHRRIRRDICLDCGWTKAGYVD